MAKLNELKNDLDWVQSIVIEQARSLDLTAYAIERSRVQDTGGPFMLYDPHMGKTIYAIPCWRCGRNIEVDEDTFGKCNYCTCSSCKCEIRKPKE